MTDQTRPGQEKFPVAMFFWFAASIVGLWFVFRNGDPKQIPEYLLLSYVGLQAMNFLAFGLGWSSGGMFHKWWASYIFVFTGAAFLSIAFWWVWWDANIILPAMLPPSPANPPSEVLKSDAVTISNLAATLFVVLIIPACCGVYFRQRKA
jgi:glucan phosphoethanolaminetransferase (alkaline phosphatase superfamily)